MERETDRQTHRLRQTQQARETWRDIQRERETNIEFQHQGPLIH